MNESEATSNEVCNFHLIPPRRRDLYLESQMYFLHTFVDPNKKEEIDGEEFPSIILDEKASNHEKRKVKNEDEFNAVFLQNFLDPKVFHFILLFTSIFVHSG